MPDALASAAAAVSGAPQIKNSKKKHHFPIILAISDNFRGFASEILIWTNPDPLLQDQSVGINLEV